MLRVVVSPAIAASHTSSGMLVALLLLHQKITKIDTVNNIIIEQTRGLVSKETVVLRRWGTETKTLDLSTELIS